MGPAADPLPGPRLALVVATNTYTDPGLRQLRAPARDADNLAQVLADPGIGGFAVTPVIDQATQQVRLAIEDFLDGRGTGDLLLVYLSCHGLLDAYRRLYFAATDTRKDRLASTGVEATWVLDQLEHCRARRQVLILDSCFSGAFAHGAKGEANLGLKDRFLGQGRGRVVLTASAATEYSFEGDPTDAATPAGSVFTAALVQGLRTGAADTDHDGLISVDDAAAYVFDRVQAVGAAQTPQRWLFGVEGKILLARNPAGPTIIPAPLPDPLQTGLDRALELIGSADPSVRIGGIYMLEGMALNSPSNHPAVMDILTAFIREHSRRPPRRRRPERWPLPDVQTALTVVGRRKARYDIRTIDLADADLADADLAGADLADADLTDSRLADARLGGADLSGADLSGADLTRADLARADLTRARLAGADLAGARFTDARLVAADLAGARFTGADLTGADLAGARLFGADLTGADLADADLADAIWPESVPIPEGWMVDSDSGDLKRAGQLSEVTAHYLW